MTGPASVNAPQLLGAQLSSGQAVPSEGTERDGADGLANTAGENGRDLVLTSRTPDGQGVSFITKPSQMQSTATIATYGRKAGAPTRVIH